MSAWKLTIRHGSDVVREEFDSLERAIEELRRHADAIRSGCPLDRVGSLRDFEPAEQVHARLEISTGGLLHRHDAGLDVMGDGTLIPYSGGVGRTELELQDGQSPFDAIAVVLAGAKR